MLPYLIAPKLENLILSITSIPEPDAPGVVREPWGRIDDTLSKTSEFPRLTQLMLVVEVTGKGWEVNFDNDHVREDSKSRDGSDGYTATNDGAPDGESQEELIKACVAAIEGHVPKMAESGRLSIKCLVSPYRYILLKRLLDGPQDISIQWEDTAHETGRGQSTSVRST